MSGGQRNSRRKEWVSHNRVLIGGNKKNVRNPNFDTEETKLLISLWGNPAIQKTLITSHKKFPIISKLSETMRQYGYQRTPEEINTRLKNLKCLYNRLKKDVECGLRSHPTWKHFSAMDAILTRPIFGYQNSGELVEDEDEDPGQLIVKDEGGEIEELDDDDELRPEDLLQVETTPAEEILLQTDDDDVIIKEEPIDVDEYEKKNLSGKSEETRNLNIEKLPKLIPRSSWLNNSSTSASSNGNGGVQNPPPLHCSQKAVARQSSVICVSSPRTISTVTSTTNSTAIPNGSGAGGGLSPHSKGKISLVPTNMLLNQQKQAAAAAAAAAGKNYFVSKSVSTITQAAMNQSQADLNKSKMPMKVLLVNTMPKQHHAQLQSPPLTRNNVDIIPIPMDHSTQQTNPGTPQQCNGQSRVFHSTPQPPPVPSSSRIGRVGKRRGGIGQAAQLTISGMKSMLSSLVRTQREANALTRERLQLDTEMFNYERRVFDEVLGLIPILKDIGAQFLQSNQANNNNSNSSQPPSTGGAAVHQQQPSSSSPQLLPQCNGHEPPPSSIIIPSEEEVIEVALAEDEDDDVIETTDT